MVNVVGILAGLSRIAFLLLAGAWLRKQAA